VVKGKTVIMVDDGLASGYIVMAAVESIRYRQPKEIIVAVPVASATALPRVEKITNRVVACVSGFGPEFYVSDFYRYWHDPSDEEVLQCFKEWGLRHRPNLETPGKNNLKSP